MNFFRLSDRKIVRATQIIMWGVVLTFLIIGLGRRYALSGVFHVTYDVNADSKLITDFASKETDLIVGLDSLESAQKLYRLITVSPVYFTAHTPREFTKATVSVTYQNPDAQQSILLGIKQADDSYYYQTMAIELPQLDNLPDYWIPIRDGNIVLWQKDAQYYDELIRKEDAYSRKKEYLDRRHASEIAAIDTAIADAADVTTREKLETEKIDTESAYSSELQSIELARKPSILPQATYESIDKFLEDPPDPNKISQFKFNLSPYIERPNYQKSTSTQTIDVAIRGKHEIITYIGDDEDLNFLFTIQEINRHPGTDNFIVEIYDGAEQLVDRIDVADDGIAVASGQVVPEREVHVLLENIPQGYYRLKFDIGDDVFIKRFVTFQQLLMFKGNVYVVDNNEYQDILGEKTLSGTLLYTDSTELSFYTAHDDGYQTIRAGSESVTISETHTPYDIAVDHPTDQLISISIPRNDVYIYGNGHFSFSPESFFSVNKAIATPLEEVESIDDYDYIIASYTQAQTVGDWKVASASVAVPQLHFEKSGYNYLSNFIISLPGLSEQNKNLKIKSVEIIFEKEPITFSNLIPRVKRWLGRGSN